MSALLLIAFGCPPVFAAKPAGKDAPSHDRPFFMPDSQRQRIRSLIESAPWAEAEFQRLKKSARKNGYDAALLFAVTGDEEYLDVAKKYVLNHTRIGGDLGPKRRDVLDDPGFFKPGQPWLGDVYYRLDIEQVRRKGAARRLIMDGDISAALAPAMHTSNIDLYAGIGGTPEAILAAAGLHCLGGGMRAKIWPRDEAERQSLIAAGWGDRLDKQYMSKDLAFGDNLVFAATGITTSPLLPGVEVRGSIAKTYSVIMRARSGTVRFIEGHHNLERKTIHLRSTGVERQI